MFGWFRYLFRWALHEKRADALDSLSRLEAPTADIERMIEEIAVGR